jgi:hypothetical protein
VKEWNCYVYPDPATNISAVVLPNRGSRRSKFEWATIIIKIYDNRHGEGLNYAKKLNMKPSGRSLQARQPVPLQVITLRIYQFAEQWERWLVRLNGTGQSAVSCQ